MKRVSLFLFDRNAAAFLRASASAVGCKELGNRSEIFRAYADEITRVEAKADSVVGVYHFSPLCKLPPLFFDSAARSLYTC
jgi:hypothetical protein